MRALKYKSIIVATIFAVISVGCSNSSSNDERVSVEDVKNPQQRLAQDERETDVALDKTGDEIKSDADGVGRHSKDLYEDAKQKTVEGYHTVSDTTSEYYQTVKEGTVNAYNKSVENAKQWYNDAKDKTVEGYNTVVDKSKQWYDDNIKKENGANE